MKKLLYYILTCVIISVVLAPIMNKQIWESREVFLMTVVSGFIYSFTGLYGSIWLFKYLDRKYDWLKDIWKRVIIGVIAVEVWSITIYVIFTPLLLYFFQGKSFYSMAGEIKANLISPVLMGLPGMLIIASIEFFNYWKKSYLKQQKLKAEMMSYKYEALHNQLNPHFLFNSFNVLTSLVFESPELAVKFIDQLSELYKRVLDCKDKELIPLEDELEFIQSYIYLLKTRFEEKLKIAVSVSAQKDEWIAPMVLQLLIENAVKHNSISKADPLLIYIERKDNVIVTRNEIRKKMAGDDSRGTGLQNIRQRYGFLTEAPIEVVEAGGEFIVRIPILKGKK